VKAIPSWLAWTVPLGMARLPMAMDTARAVNGFANSSWIQAGAPPSGMGRATVLFRSPSTIAATSKSPPLRVTLGWRSAIRASPSGTRYAMTALSP